MFLLDALEFLEVLDILVGFWAFLFSSKFRKKKRQEWKKRGLWGRLLIPVEIALALFFGTMPFWLLYLLAGNR